MRASARAQPDGAEPVISARDRHAGLTGSPRDDGLAALAFVVPSRSDLHLRQAWMADPEFMAYNAGWDVRYPGYDRLTGCIDWPESQWAAFEERLRLPADRQGYFYVRDAGSAVVVGHAHYEVDDQGAAHIGINVVPACRGRGLGVPVLRLLVERVWRDTTAEQIVNEFEDGREPAVRTHRRCGFVADAQEKSEWGRPTRVWRLPRMRPESRTSSCEPGPGLSLATPE